MSREDYLRLAAQGLRMPIGSDLLLREQPDAEKILTDGPRLGEIVAGAARRYRTPLAMPVMDLTVEKAAMLTALDIPADQIDTFHFHETPSGAAIDRITAGLDLLACPRTRANIQSITTVSRDTTLIPLGMVIGPFSLLTKLLDDAITPVFIAGTGASADDEEEVRQLDVVLDLCLQVVIKSAAAQVAAGAKAIVVCEPAANKVYFSPNQLDAGSDIFERYAMGPNRRLAESIRAAGSDLVFHCCGELTDEMVRAFVRLNPVMLSLGSSRQLWRDAAMVPRDIVLYGNLPSKKFYSDALITVGQVAEMGAELLSRMREAGHPFILGTECDVLSVPEAHATIKQKVDALVHCSCKHQQPAG